MDTELQIVLGVMFTVQLITFVYIRWIYLKVEYPED